MPPLPQPPHPILSPGQFDNWLNLPAGTIRKLCRAGVIPHFAIRGDYRIVVTEALPRLMSLYIHSSAGTAEGKARG